MGEILQLYGIVDVNSFVGSQPSVDSKGKFIRTVIASQQHSNRKKRAFKHLEIERNNRVEEKWVMWASFLG